MLSHESNPPSSQPAGEDAGPWFLGRDQGQGRGGVWEGVDTGGGEGRYAIKGVDSLGGITQQ